MAKFSNVLRATAFLATIMIVHSENLDKNSVLNSFIDVFKNNILDRIQEISDLTVMLKDLNESIESDAGVQGLYYNLTRKLTRAVDLANEVIDEAPSSVNKPKCKSYVDGFKREQEQRIKSLERRISDLLDSLLKTYEKEMGIFTEIHEKIKRIERQAEDCNNNDCAKLYDDVKSMISNYNRDPLYLPHLVPSLLMKALLKYEYFSYMEDQIGFQWKIVSCINNEK